MCGITGAVFKQAADAIDAIEGLKAALETLKHRGPDHQGYETFLTCLLGHARLSILDLSEAAHQPMADPTGRYMIAFNGEIFNYTALKAELEAAGVRFQTTSDTEVLLHLLILQGPEALKKLNGFFAIAFYDIQEQRLLLARDRYGVKPLLYWVDELGVRYASELKALLAMGIERRLDATALALYLQLNYVPPAMCMLQGVQKLPAAHYMWIEHGVQSVPTPYYSIPAGPKNYHADEADYQLKQRELETLLEDAVRLRLVADVPVGVFLSGGIDSSVVATLAKRHKQDLKTYSIGFVNPLFDETKYALAVAEKIGSDHKVIRLHEDDLFAHLYDVLDYLDEPFADASAINMYILSKEVRKHVTVALSGDGADELFGGYAKHTGELRASERGLPQRILRLLKPLVLALPASRNSKMGRKLYQIQKFTELLGMPFAERFWHLASPATANQVKALLLKQPNAARLLAVNTLYAPYSNDVSETLRSDFALCLAGDMLPKVDFMSMANSLEVRTPFLDYRVVDFAFGLPTSYKINTHQRKRIVQDAFRPYLPEMLYNRPKQGFEVPLRDWFIGPLRGYLEEHVVSEKLLAAQGIFNSTEVKRIWQTVLAGRNRKEDLTLWALLVFQHWMKRVKPQLA